MLKGNGAFYGNEAWGGLGGSERVPHQEDSQESKDGSKENHYNPSSSLQPQSIKILSSQ